MFYFQNDRKLSAQSEQIAGRCKQYQITYRLDFIYRLGHFQFRRFSFQMVETQRNLCRFLYNDNALFKPSKIKLFVEFTRMSIFRSMKVVRIPRIFINKINYENFHPNLPYRNSRKSPQLGKFSVFTLPINHLKSKLK